MTEAIRASRPGRPAPASYGPVSDPPRNARPGSSFASALERAQRSENVRFSLHAQKRLDARAIQLDDGHLARLTDAVERAAHPNASRASAARPSARWSVPARKFAWAS